MFKKILIANRGEIACRVIKTCKDMGINTVAVYSDADENAMHVELADESFCIGGSASSDSYLVIDKIINACLECGAEAVHPGYGFLSENDDFAKALEKNNIVFIGPKRKAIVCMGDKIESKKIAAEAEVNVIPGFTQAIKDSEQAVKVANDIGYPVMLKASAGGGGKGMRVVNNDQECVDGFERAQNESLASFGDDRIFAEKFITEPHHIEIQILADQQGNTVYLGERECSIQRRHQKVIEEAPSPFISNATRIKMGEQAVNLAKAVNYESAGTVEFIVDKEQQFYFLEMNTRLQVEHPVTEMVTGIDLVEKMITIAAGEPLNLEQDKITTSGWALESRIYAEDPYREFMPSIGRLTKYRTPQSSMNIRIDTGIREGSEVTMFYDPMIAKLITYGNTRDEAIQYMLSAIDQYVITGVSHNLNFLSSIMQNPTFRSGYTTTNFIADEYQHGFKGEPVTEDETQAIACVLACYHTHQLKRIKTNRINTNQWTVKINEHQISVRTEDMDSIMKATSQANEYSILINKQHNDPRVKIKINDKECYFQIENKYPGYQLTHRGKVFTALVSRQRTAELNRLMPEKIPLDLSKYLLSPMPGLLLKLCVLEGQTIKAGEELAVVEAMKMENSLRASKDVKIKSILTTEGANLTVDQKILEFED
jgi:propionyl-CoA carboxylase alpha chain